MSDDEKWPFLACFKDGEAIGPVECKTTGNFPKWLHGSLFRTGPGIYNIKSDTHDIRLGHWFDGMGITHKFTFSDASVKYQSVITSQYTIDSLKQHGVTGITFGHQQDLCQTMFQKVFSYFIPGQRVKEPGNVNVTVTPDFIVPATKERLCVLKTDYNILQVIDPISLEPKLEELNYGVLKNELQAGATSVAHHEYDPKTKSFINFIANPGQNPEYIVFETTPSDTKILARFHDPNLAYLHSFSSTSRYVILQLWPLSYGWKGLKISLYKCLVDAMEWSSDRKTRIVVIDRSQSRVVAEYQYDSVFCFHTVNAFDDPESGDVIMDMLIYKTGRIVDAFTMDAMTGHGAENPHVQRARELSDPKFRRVRLSNLRLACKEYKGGQDSLDLNAPFAETVFEYQGHFMELATINPTWRHAHTYRYVYALSTAQREMHSHFLFDSIVKFDITSKTAKVWWKAGHTPSEALFVPSPNGTDEDDGVLLSVVLDGVLGKSYLLVLDAKSMVQIATAEIGEAVPFGLHGAFLPSQ